MAVRGQRSGDPAREDLRSRLSIVRRFFVILVRLLFVLFQSARTDSELLIRRTVFGRRGRFLLPY